MFILFQAAAAGAGGDAEEDEDIDDEGKILSKLVKSCLNLSNLV
jgi:hypothetical protein